MSTRGHHRIRSKRKKKGAKKARESLEKEAQVDERDEGSELENEVSPSE
jgi:hypothetical protein